MNSNYHELRGDEEESKGYTTPRSPNQPLQIIEQDSLSPTTLIRE